MCGMKAPNPLGCRGQRVTDRGVQLRARGLDLCLARGQGIGRKAVAVVALAAGLAAATVGAWLPAKARGAPK